METQNNVADLNAAREAKAAAEQPNLTAAEAATVIVTQNATSLVTELAKALPFRLDAEASKGGHFHLNFAPEGGMHMAAHDLGIAHVMDGLKPTQLDIMFTIGLFLIHQAEIQILSLQVQHVTAQLEKLEADGVLKLGPTVSPELVAMLASMQNQASEVTDSMITANDAAPAAKGE